MKQATYRVIHFTKPGRFVAMAWNYDAEVLLATTDHDTYTDARAELDELARERGVELRWFDGSYTCAGNGYQLESEGGSL